MEAGNEERGARSMLVRALEIPATAEAPTLARRWLDEIRELPSLGQAAFDLRLLVTELVANSVRHAGLEKSDPITVVLALDQARIRVEVRDTGRGFVLPLRPQKRSVEGGRGLQIIAAISDRWGVQQGVPFAVWFEIDLAPRGAASAEAGVPRTCPRDLVP